MEHLDQGLEFIETTSHPFSTTLMNLVVARGITQSGLNAFKEAEDSFRRAQHISHRIGGVYTPDQLKVVEHITRLDLKQGRILDADQNQAFSLLVSEHSYGKESEKLLPVLERVGAYFAAPWRNDAAQWTAGHKVLPRFTVQTVPSACIKEQ